MLLFMCCSVAKGRGSPFWDNTWSGTGAEERRRSCRSKYKKGHKLREGASKKTIV